MIAHQWKVTMFLHLMPVQSHVSTELLCLETGPPLQPKLFDIFVRSQLKRFVVTVDVQKAFLQISIDDRDRDVQRILCYNNLEDRLIKQFCCSRVIFGASPSPYILGVTIERHLEQYNGEYTDTINTLKKDTYVDDIQGGADSIKSLRRFKVEATQIMAKARFTLHNWHSNVRALELDEVDEALEEMSVKANCNTKVLRIRFHTLHQKI